MAMDTLSKDIISYIGTFLEDEKDLRNCREAAQVLSCIAYASKYHILTCTTDIIDNFKYIYRAIKRIKPNCDIVMILRPYLYNHIQYCMRPVLDMMHNHSDIILQLEYGKMSTFLPMLPNGSRLRLITSFLTMQDVIHISRVKCEYLHTLIDDDNAFLLKQYSVCNIPKLDIHVASITRAAIDLSSVNIKRNTEVNITYTGTDFYCIAPHKVTCVEEHVIDHGRSLERFFASCMDDPLFHTSRMQRVYIYKNTRVTDHNIWFRFAMILPDDVEYCVAAHDPSVKEFITKLKSCGAKRFRYLCFSKDTLLHAHMCRLVFPDHAYPLELSLWCKNADICTRVIPTSIISVYNEMTYQSKHTWLEYIPSSVFHKKKRCIDCCTCM